VTTPAPAGAALPPPFSMPARARVSMYLRLLMIQSSWNYEALLGNGIGFCVEPALRLLPGGRDGPAYREALARESQYFNAHPYLAGIAVGALSRVELDQEPAARIERFRTALCGPLGSVGDRLVWAAWLPLCSVLALLAFGLGAGPGWVLAIFLGIYNVGHLALRGWALHVGWAHGLRVASALGHPVLRHGPQYLGQAAALVGGAALPLAVDRIIGPGHNLLGIVLAAVVIGAVIIARLHGRFDGWRLAIVALGLFVLYSLAR
jgi:PTS system mannose-specific IID component